MNTTTETRNPQPDKLETVLLPTITLPPSASP